MSTIRLLRDQLQQAHGFLESALADVTAEQAHWRPEGLANPLGATYAHLLVGEDAFVAGLRGEPALFADGWADRVGVSELPPLGQPGDVLPLQREWHDWGRRVRVDLPALRAYGGAVHGTADHYLAGLSDDDLSRPLDLTSAGFGEQTHGLDLERGPGRPRALALGRDRLPERAAGRPRLPRLSEQAGQAATVGATPASPAPPQAARMANMNRGRLCPPREMENR